MARSNDFQGIRHGSAGNLTYYELDGRQITKSRAYDVRNPRTERQAFQRMRWNSATKFMAFLEGTIRNSFENIAHDKHSLRRFIQLAARENGSGFLLGVEKDSYYFWPEGYQISDGSLQPNDAVINGTTIQMRSWTTGAVSFLNFMLRNSGLATNDVLTFIAIFNKFDSVITENTDPRFNLVYTDTITLANSGITDYQNQPTDYGFFNINFKECTAQFMATTIVDTAPLAVAVITNRPGSTLSEEKRSPESMALAPIRTEAGRAINARALATYLPKPRRLHSNRYLNGG